MDLTTRQKIAVLEAFDFTIGERDDRLNTDFDGNFMVVEAVDETINEYDLPTRDGSNGPWCVVGDDLDSLVDTAYDYLADMDPPELEEVIASVQRELPERKFTSLASARLAP